MLNTLPPGGQSEDREEIEQVRTLLFGEIQQQNEKRFAEMESRMRDFRVNLEQQISAVAASGASSQANLFRALGSAIAELGNQIQRLADGHGQGERGNE
jgi:hypothetical protein